MFSQQKLSMGGQRDHTVKGGREREREEEVHERRQEW